MNYNYINKGDYSIRNLVGDMATELNGLFVVCTSFDSKITEFKYWVKIGKYSGKIIDSDLIAHWPLSHDKYCDEWWVFKKIPGNDFTVNAFCNYVGMTIDQRRELNWDDGCPIEAYIKEYAPEMVFGNNEKTYLITRPDLTKRRNGPSVFHVPT